MPEAAGLLQHGAGRRRESVGLADTGVKISSTSARGQKNTTDIHAMHQEIVVTALKRGSGARGQPAKGPAGNRRAKLDTVRK